MKLRMRIAVYEGKKKIGYVLLRRITPSYYEAVPHARLPERSNGPVCKTDLRKQHVGSNPTPSFMRKMKLKEAIDILRSSEDKQLQAIANLFDDARSKMNALFEVASGEYHGNEGNEENEIDEILFEASQVLDRPYTRFVEDEE